MDCGDFVVVVNAATVKLTGNKEKAKLYTNYSGYPGGQSIDQIHKEILQALPQK
jgi:large subunit ribosomal protein L13